MKRGEVWQPRRGKGLPWYAWRRIGGAWRRRSTGRREQRAAAAVAARWLEEAASPTRSSGRSEIGGQLEEFLRAVRLSPAVSTERHVRELRSILSRLAAASGWKTLEDVTTESLLAGIDVLASRSRRGWSNATRNGARAAAKAFSRWAYLDGRLERDPLARVKRWPTEGFERRPRRALTPMELERLLTFAAGNGELFGLHGYQRSALYVLAVATGLRLGELAAITAKGLQLDEEPPTVRVPATVTKNGREAVQAILPVVKNAREWVRRGLALCDQRPGRPM